MDVLCSPKFPTCSETALIVLWKKRHFMVHHLGGLIRVTFYWLLQSKEKHQYRCTYLCIYIFMYTVHTYMPKCTSKTQPLLRFSLFSIYSWTRPEMSLAPPSKLKQTKSQPSAIKAILLWSQHPNLSPSERRTHPQPPKRKTTPSHPILSILSHYQGGQGGQGGQGA